jgi:hypothetical protein
MFRPITFSASEPRRGVVLMVVLAILTLFAIIGLSFVLYADAASKSAEIARDTELTDLQPQTLLDFFLGQLTTDADNLNGIYSALRGHSLARTAYGYNDNSTGLNLVPFNGIGRVKTGAVTYGSIAFPDDYAIVNYTYFPADGFLRDPERMGSRPNNLTDWHTNQYYGFNAPYTYPDLNNMFLAAVKADGTVLMPSFHRSWLFNPANALNDQSNPNWTNAQGKYFTLRPRPADMGPNFPYPEDAGGDVKNLVGGPGGNDSIWIDLGFPVITDKGGRKYKPLFAPLIIDLDNRINVNVHGNILGAGGAHASNQGHGSWEVNVNQVLADANYPQEWIQLFAGNSSNNVIGRYGADQSPGTAGSLATFLGPQWYTAQGNPQPVLPFHFYSPIDFDGRADNGTPTPVVNPIGAGLSCFPTFATGATGYGNVSTAEQTNHPSIYNYFQLAGDDRKFGLSEMEALLRYGDVGASSIASDLFALCPNNFYQDTSDPIGCARRRRLVTTIGFDMDRPGSTPWIWPSTTSPPSYNLAAGTLYPSGGAVNFPTPGTAGANTAPTEFGADWRSILAAIGHLDLNRPLPEYPAPTGTPPTIAATSYGAFMAAQAARQQLASDIFRVLLSVTMALQDPGSITNPSPQYDAARWLAQLAVNIVDFIDNDDYMTPFQWNPATSPTDFVYGTEMPRALINEALVMFDTTATNKLYTWVELYNPLNTDAGSTDPSQGGANLSAYQILICAQGTDAYIRQPSNTAGDPTSQPALLLNGPNGVVPPPGCMLGASNGAASGGPGQTSPFPGYCVVGSITKALGTGGGQADVKDDGMIATLPAGTTGPTMPPPTIVLRRLACEYLPFQNNPALPMYNPYITVDYMVDADHDPDPTKNLIIQPNPTGTPPTFGNDYAHQTATDFANQFSDGRLQPYAGNSGGQPPVAANTLRNYQKPQPVVATQPQNTFWNVNWNLSTNMQIQPGTFQWLLHLDRALTSPMELMNVSGFKPHELTQEFIDPLNGLKSNMQPFTHRVPWFDEDQASAATPTSHYLYRLFEFVQTRSRASYQQAWTTPSQTPTPITASGGTPVSGTVFPVNQQGLPAMYGLTASGMPVAIQPGSTVVLDYGTSNQENVVVSSVTGTSFTVTATATSGFFQSHNNPTIMVTNAPIWNPGTTPPYQPVLQAGGDRIPGKTNINTIWGDPTGSTNSDGETFAALSGLPLVGASSNNFALNPDVSSIFTKLLSLRTPSGTPSGSDNPFLGYGTGLYPAADSQFPGYGVNNSNLRSFNTGGLGNSARLFEIESANPYSGSMQTTHPYLRYQLLGKLFNNITTRSNVFAVWLTVGFFEVTDDTVRPVKLGAEIGRATGQNLRHRMFAIVDRSSLVAPATGPAYAAGLSYGIPVNATTLSSAVSTGATTFQVPQISGAITPPNALLPGLTWTIQAPTAALPIGTALMIDAGTSNQETVVVSNINTSTNPPTITMDTTTYNKTGFVFNHNQGASVVINYYPGNPGPQPNFKAAQNTAVVPYYNIIE